MKHRIFTPLSIILALLARFRPSLTVFATVIFFLAADAGVSESIRAGNSREVCRKSISSSLGSLVADRAQAEDSVELSKTYKEKARLRVAAEEVKLKVINKTLESTDFTPDTMSKQNQIATSIKLYHTQMLESDDQLEHSKKRLASVDSRLAKLRKKVDVIFKVSMNDDPDGGPRKIFNTIDWLSPCPKYRMLCPLPEADLKVLISITDEIDDVDQGCLHYIKIK